jgi:hypothetical protein
MVVAGTKFNILNPTVEAIPDNTVLAKRPDDLNGKTVGLLSNGKRNADKLLDAVVSLLQDTYELKDVVRVNKGDASRPVPKHMLDELLEKCDFVITATGD